MKKIIAYLLLFLIVLAGIVGMILAEALPSWLLKNQLWLLCAISGGVGGCLYCLRGVYLNACVRKSWDPCWQPWYYIRPFASVICGAVSCLFLKAGLLILEAGQRSTASELGFLALSFIAGLNVDKFVSKIEDVAQAAWGIEKSRSASAQKSKPEQNEIDSKPNGLPPNPASSEDDG